jgi:hypothetical protein
MTPAKMKTAAVFTSANIIAADIAKPTINPLVTTRVVTY